MSDINLTLQENGGVYLAITETPSVVTLSQAVISGALASTVTVANTVTVALDANSLSALENVTVTVGAAVSVGNVVSVNVVTMPALSISSVSISNFPSTQTIAGTVTANPWANYAPPISAVEDGNPESGMSIAFGRLVNGTAIVGEASPLPISGTKSSDESSTTAKTLPVQLVNLSEEIVGIPSNPLPISGTVTANGGDFTAVDGSVTIPARAAAIGFYDTAGSGLFKLANSDDQLFPVRVANLPTTQGISGTVSVGNSVTIGSCVTHGVRLQDGSGNNLTSTSIGGVQRLNVSLASAATPGGTLPSFVNVYGGSDGSAVRTISVDSSGRTVVTGTLLVSQTGSVTIGSLPNSLSIVNSSSVTKANVQYTAIAGSVNDSPASPSYTMRPITVNSSGQIYIDANPNGQSVFSNDGTSHIFVKPTPNTTVTISALPNGALTTRFGSVTTANTSQLTSCVTNSSRKYLLAQNISAGTVTIGIGFSPTTTQGIQLSAGGGISFDSFCPTGAVWWLGATTGANFTILEG